MLSCFIISIIIIITLLLFWLLMICLFLSCQASSSFRWNLRGAAATQNDPPNLFAFLKLHPEKIITWKWRHDIIGAECRCWLDSLNSVHFSIRAPHIIPISLGTLGVKGSHLMNRSCGSLVEKAPLRVMHYGCNRFQPGPWHASGHIPRHGVYPWVDWGTGAPLHSANSEALFFRRREGI